MGDAAIALELLHQHPSHLAATHHQHSLSAIAMRLDKGDDSSYKPAPQADKKHGQRPSDQEQTSGVVGRSGVEVALEKEEKNRQREQICDGRRSQGF